MSSIITSFEQLTISSPDKTLFEENERSISISEFDQLTSNYASHLYNIGVRSSDNIAILLPRGIDAVAAIYSIVKLGGCFVPIDIKSPSSRQSFIVNDAGCQCVIGKGECPQWLTDLQIDYVDIAEIRATENTLITITATAISNKANRAILYTSGSTGTPKGVVISDLAIMSFSRWSVDAFSIDSTERIANLTPFHFDLSLFDLFAGPLSAATTVFIPESLTLSPSKLVDWLIEKAITCWYTVPSILGFIVFKGNLSNKALPNLKQVLFAGEVFATEKVIELARLLPETNFYNLFGPTETNVCLYWPVNRQQLKVDTSIPIGKAASEAELKICPHTQQLLVKGPCLMNGYRNNGKLKLPVDEQGWFATGDQVSLNSYGEYCYHGRLDRMIKSAGYRIEPAEIEQALNAISGIHGAAVIATQDPRGGTRIVAAVVGVDVNRHLIKKQLLQKLPTYMHPVSYVFLDSLPLLSNGKIDYQKIETMLNANTNQ